MNGVWLGKPKGMMKVDFECGLLYLKTIYVGFHREWESIWACNNQTRDKLKVLTIIML